MAFFIVTMTHPDGEGWDMHVAAHVDYLNTLVRSGRLRASGPLKGTPKRAGLLIFETASLAQADKLVADDPLAVEGLIESPTVTEWDPLLGIFAAESSGVARARTARVNGGVAAPLTRTS